MTHSTTITADYSLRPSELADALARLVEARQPVIVWGPPGCAKSQIAQQVASAPAQAPLHRPPPAPAARLQAHLLPPFRTGFPGRRRPSHSPALPP